MLGQYADAGNISFNPHTITRKQLQLIGSWGFEPRHVDRALSLLAATNLKTLFASEITHRFPLAEANTALETVREWRSGKAVLEPYPLRLECRPLSFRLIVSWLISSVVVMTRAFAE